MLHRLQPAEDSIITSGRRVLSVRVLCHDDGHFLSETAVDGDLHVVYPPPERADRCVVALPKAKEHILAGEGQQIDCRLVECRVARTALDPCGPAGQGAVEAGRDEAIIAAKDYQRCGV